MLRRIVWQGQWPAIVLLPVWLAVGSSIVGGAMLWTVMAVALAAGLIAGPLFSRLLSPDGTLKSRADGYTVVTLLLWIAAIALPFTIAPTDPNSGGLSWIELHGASSIVGDTLVRVLEWAVPVLLVVSWFALILDARRATHPEVTEP